jgi:hypothetical protein
MLRRFSQGRGLIRRKGQPLAGATGGSLIFSNNIERVRVIREDGRIEAADHTLASAEGSMSVRFHWRAAFDESEGMMLRAHLLNEITSYS